jgi:hypothetical protein
VPLQQADPQAVRQLPLRERLGLVLADPEVVAARRLLHGRDAAVVAGDVAALDFGGDDHGEPAFGKHAVEIAVGRRVLDLGRVDEAEVGERLVEHLDEVVGQHVLRGKAQELAVGRKGIVPRGVGLHVVARTLDDERAVEVPLRVVLVALVGLVDGGEDEAILEPVADPGIPEEGPVDDDVRGTRAERVADGGPEVDGLALLQRPGAALRGRSCSRPASARLRAWAPPPAAGAARRSGSES